MSNPADPTAAAVSSPEMAEAIVKPERTSMMMKSMIIPRGVLIMLIIVPEAFPDGIIQHLPSGQIPTGR